MLWAGPIFGPSLQLRLLQRSMTPSPSEVLRSEKDQCEKRASMGQWRGLLKEAIDYTAIVAKFLCLLHVTNNYLFSSTFVYGTSMLPTLNVTGDVLLAEHVSHRVGRVGPGDVVLVRSPLNPRKMLTKRIVGVEGDKVNFFLDTADSNMYQSAVVPKGHVWIQGDNVYGSNDSRHYGPVPYGLIQGKLFLRVWPPDCFGPLEH